MISGISAFSGLKVVTAQKSNPRVNQVKLNCLTPGDPTLCDYSLKLQKEQNLAFLQIHSMIIVDQVTLNSTLLQSIQQN